MSETGHVVLTGRGILRVAGEDAQDFLQGLFSNDMRKAGPTRALHAALLTPQGKYLFDMFVFRPEAETFLLDTEAARMDDLLRRLTLYRLRAKVVIDDVSEAFTACAAIGPDVATRFDLEATPGRARALADGMIAVDPRLAALGLRAVLPHERAAEVMAAHDLPPLPFVAYDRLRLAHGVADGTRDLLVDKSILLESGFDELNGVAFDKGCFVGQELTARTKHRALIRKRLLPVTIVGPAPEFGTPVRQGDREVGDMRSHAGELGLALLRLDALTRAGEAPLRCGEATLQPHIPDWAHIAPGEPAAAETSQ